MNTVKKILSGAAVAAIIPMTAFANTADVADITQSPRDAEEQHFTEPKVNLGLGPDQISVAEADFDSYLADATLIDSPVTGKLVVSEDQQLIGSVSNVYEKPDGQMMAEVALDQTLDTDGSLALVPVTTVNEAGNVVMDGDYDAIRNTMIQKDGYDPQS